MRQVQHPPSTRPANRITLVLIALLVTTDQLSADDAERRQRLRMVEQYIEAEGVSNERVLQAMRRVPRHEFVPGKLASRAYTDAALPIGFRQTISPPFIVAYMTETIDPQPEHRVLEIGTGSGYQAAVLSGLVNEVYSIEIVRQLGNTAKRRLEKLGYRNVHTKVGDGYQGWPEHAPFDSIIVTCSPESVPQPLVDQLREGGRMIIPLGERYQQVFHLMKKRDGRLVQEKLIPTLFVPMTGISEDNREIQPDPRMPGIVNGSFELDENGDGLADNWHYQRQTSLSAEGAVDGQRYVCFENEEPGRPAQMLQGTAIDGRRVRALLVRIRVQHEDVKPGDQPDEIPAAMVHFYDASRKMFHTTIIGPWRGNLSWQRFSKTIQVPAKAREMIFRVGLNGATGRLCVDGFEATPVAR